MGWWQWSATCHLGLTYSDWSPDIVKSITEGRRKRQQRRLVGMDWKSRLGGCRVDTTWLHVCSVRWTNYSGTMKNTKAKESDPLRENVSNNLIWWPGSTDVVGTSMRTSWLSSLVPAWEHYGCYTLVPKWTYPGCHPRATKYSNQEYEVQFSVWESYIFSWGWLDSLYCCYSEIVLTCFYGTIVQNMHDYINFCIQISYHTYLILLSWSLIPLDLVNPFAICMKDLLNLLILSFAYDVK